jgi:DNA-directed RNA polymerase specialized sigma24 family protein
MEDATQDQAGLEADRRLAQRCVAGEVAAWEEIYAQCHDPLLAGVRVLLSGWTSDANLVDEIAAQVWYALVADDGKLLAKYDPARGGRLTTFMRAIAKGAVGQYLRSEQRRLEREREASYGKPPHHVDDQDQVAGAMDEFLETLGPGERQFCDEHLLGSPGDGDGEQNGKVSRAGFWHRSHRIYRRLLRFLGHGK